MPSLRERLLDVPQRGVVTWLGVRPEHGVALEELEQARAIAGLGLERDVASRGRAGGKRQVTLVQAEHLPVIASFTGLAELRPAQIRRNVAVSGINLLALVKLRFAIGDEVILLGTGACAPCSKMDEVVGTGAFQAMRGHGGITASVERGGMIRIGDVVRVLAPGSETE
jgi:MOSC domain-containing protein YiiM